jgi:hypothetical protein
MQKASDIGKPTVPIDLIGPDHWPRSKRGGGRATKLLLPSSAALLLQA